MSQLTLRHRLLLLTLLPSALIAIVLVGYFTYSGIRTLEGELRAKGMATVRYLAPVSEYGIIAGQLESLHGLAQATVQESGVKATVIVNQKGRTIAVSGRVSLAAEDLRRTLSEPTQIGETEHWIAFAAPVKRSVSESDVLFDPSDRNKSLPPEIIGHVFVEFDKIELVNKQRQLLQRGLMIVLSGLLILAALAIAMADNLARPVQRLVQAVKGMSSGKFNTRVPADTSGEILTAFGCIPAPRCGAVRGQPALGEYLAVLGAAHDVSDPLAKSLGELLCMTRGNDAAVRVPSEIPGREYHAAVARLSAAWGHCDDQQIPQACIHLFESCVQ